MVLLSVILVLVNAALFQARPDLLKAKGQNRRICGTVVAHEQTGRDGSGDCGTRLYLGQPPSNATFYFLVPQTANGAFPVHPVKAFVHQHVCVTGTIAVDPKNVPHVVVAQPHEVDVSVGGRPLFGEDAYLSCERGLTLPRLRREVKPSYTRELMEQRVEDVVDLDVVIGRDGRVSDARVLHGRYPAMNRQAVEAVKGWLFHPGRFSGQPVPVIAQVELTFTLR
jgi:TonB family protein